MLSGSGLGFALFQIHNGAHQPGEGDGAQADALQQLLGQDPGALKALVGLASGHEAACLHLIYVARSQPAAFDKLSGVPMTYSLALALVRHIRPEGFSRLEQMAATHADACFLLGVAYERHFWGHLQRLVHTRCRIWSGLLIGMAGHGR